MFEKPVTYKVRNDNGHPPIAITIQLVNLEDKAGKLHPKIKVQFGYSNTSTFMRIKDEIKLLSGAQFKKEYGNSWFVDYNEHNVFCLQYYSGIPIYARWETPPHVDDYVFNYPLMPHQRLAAACMIQRRCFIYAGEMGVGKSLTVIAALDHIPIIGEVIYVGPNSALQSFIREVKKWKARHYPDKFYTFEKFKNYATTHEGTAPQVLIIDESHNVKTPNAQRSIAVKYVADACRAEWGDLAHVILLTGTPAPKSPIDWWHQCEIAWPGYIIEGSDKKLGQRLSLIKYRESAMRSYSTIGNDEAVQRYPERITWLDDENKCAICGRADPNHPVHTDRHFINPTDNTDTPHNYQKSVNEVLRLSERMKGLVLVHKKADCLDLPDKQYRELRIRPDASMLRKAELIKTMAERAIQALENLRQLSDGFQYSDVEVGQIPCPTCGGSGRRHLEPDASGLSTVTEACETTCPKCNGKKTITKYESVPTHIGTPKEPKLLELLEEFEPAGRLVVWAAYTHTIDHLTKLIRQQGWHVLQITGQGGFCTFAPPGEDPYTVEDLLDAMDASHPRRKELASKIEKLCVVANAKAGGQGLTFTMSPAAVYYSNSFDGMARFQSEDRIHRAGMDTNRNAQIIDMLMFSQDLVVLQNLKLKKDLQTLSEEEASKLLRMAGDLDYDDQQAPLPVAHNH